MRRRAKFIELQMCIALFLLYHCMSSSKAQHFFIFMHNISYVIRKLGLKNMNKSMKFFANLKFLCLT